MNHRDGKVGVWVVGARGSVATTAMVGAAAVSGGLASTTGLVTARPPFSELPLPGVTDLVFGGHDISDSPLTKRAESLAAHGVMPAHVVASVADALGRIEDNLRPGAVDDGTDPATAIARVRRDIEHFRDANDLDRVVVVNLSSTEPPTPQHDSHDSLEALRAAIADGSAPLPRSAVYAIAAFEAGCPFLDFTPGAATQLPALAELAEERGLPFAGRDGKTGETLVKTALAPMFANRALRVHSWTGVNLLGGGDGANLADAENVTSKLASKKVGIETILGYPIDGPLHIDYVADLGEWKTAWDYISFEGFLGTRMRMQFTWEGCDSTLAAPLVLDLVRLVALAHQRGEAGVLTPLAYFFKDPLGTDEHRLERQYGQLCTWASGLADSAESPSDARG